MSDFLAWLGGADLDVLRQVGSARNRFVQMAVVLITTAGIAVLSMSFALHDGMSAKWYWAVPLGVVWGAIILNIDRFLVLSLGSTRNVKHLVAIALPRVLMAVVLSLAISTPLVLRIFKSDIDLQMYTTHMNQSQQQSAQLANSKETTEAADLAKQISQDQAVLDGQLPDTVTSPALQRAQQSVKSLQAQQRSAQHDANVAYEAWKCELYGAGSQCHQASDRRGPGPLAGAKKREFRDAEAQLEDLKAQLTQAKAAEAAAEKKVAGTQASALAAAQRDVRAKLPALRERYAQIQATLQKTSDKGTSVNFDDTGFLAQLRALSDLSGQDGMMLAAHLVVMALFFLIEILPVTVKILLNLQPMTAYEVVAKAADDELMAKLQAQRIEARRIEEGKSQARLAVEDDMRQREEELGKKANEHVAGEMTSILDVALREWSDQVKARLAGAGPPATTNGAGPAGPATPTPGSPAPGPGGQNPNGARAGSLAGQVFGTGHAPAPTISLPGPGVTVLPPQGAVTTSGSAASGRPSTTVRILGGAAGLPDPDGI